MAYKQQELGLIIRLDPVRARVLVLDALNKNEGFVTEAAEYLDVGLTSLHRWIAALGLIAHVHEIKRQYGHPSRGRKRLFAA